MYHVNRLQLTAQIKARKPLMAMLRSGLRPTQQCRTMVRVRAATEKKEEVMSYMERTVSKGN
jgi:hypothetical protein